MSLDQACRVSICTPTRNRGVALPILAECIKNQAYPNHLIEWVIADDSDSPIESILDSLDLEVEIKYQYLDNPLPIGRKRNISTEMCSGDIIINFDDDDFYPVDRISHAVESLQGSSFYMAGCSIVPILFIKESSLWISKSFGKNHAIANTFAFKKELLELTKYNDLDTFGEEKYFLKNYNLNLLQLDPFKTVITIAHSSNTVDKYKVVSQAEGIPEQFAPFKEISELTIPQREIISELSEVYESLLT